MKFNRPHTNTFPHKSRIKQVEIKKVDTFGGVCICVYICRDEGSGLVFVRQLNKYTQKKETEMNTKNMACMTDSPELFLFPSKTNEYLEEQLNW